MGILAHEQWAIDAPTAPAIAYGLGNGQNVGFRERAVQRRAAMSARAEAYQLGSIPEVWMALIIVVFQAGRIDQELFWSRLACEWGNCHMRSPLPSVPA